MVDQAPRTATTTTIAVLAERLKGRRGLLAAGAALFVVFFAAGSLGAAEAGFGIAILIVFALLLPHAADEAIAPVTAALQRDNAGDQMARAMADALPDPCLILDRRSAVMHRNPAAARQFPSVVPGDPLAFSLRQPALLAAVDAARRTGVAQSIELHQTVPTETWHKVSVSPLADPQTGLPDRARLLVVTLHDLTEARRVDAMRADFIANASHELRTPLTSLVGFIDTLLGPAAKDAAAREKFLGIMRSQANRMSKLIDDLLSLSRIEMRQHLRPTATLDLAGLLREVVEGLLTQAREAEVVVNLDLPDGPVTVTGERDELYEVFENLIENAIKYGGDGGKVDVTLAPVAERRGFDYAVTVTDYGAGIEAEHVPRLTERFYRVDAESSRKKKGTGLGLAIVKHILTRHRGALSIKSRPGEGMRVEVLLPK